MVIILARTEDSILSTSRHRKHVMDDAMMLSVKTFLIYVVFYLSFSPPLHQV